MKRNLLQIVQSILSDADGVVVNSISDTNEADQVASIVQDVYEQMIATRAWPEHGELMKLTAASDSNFPTHFLLSDPIKKIDTVWYENSDGRYVETQFLEPLDFLHYTDQRTENYTVVYDKNGATKIRIANNQDPSYYTSFDDYWIVMDAHKSATEATLQESKVRAWGYKLPTFTKSDTFTPDLDASAFPLLIAEAKSMYMDIHKGGTVSKVEQSARRQKAYVQNDKYRTKQPFQLSTYGR